MGIELKITPKKGESLYSIIFRNAEAHFYDHPSEFFSGNHIRRCLNTLNFSYYKPKPEWRQVIEHFNHYNIEAFDYLLNKYDQTIIGKKGVKNDLDKFYYQRWTQFCPECLREEFYHQLVWDIRIVTVCLKHKRYILDRCPCCESRVTLSQLMQGFCNCGHYFEKEGGDAIPPNDVVLEAQMTLQGFLVEGTQQVQIQNGEAFTAREYFSLLDLHSTLIDKFPGNHRIFDDIEIRTEDRINYFVNGKGLGERDVKMHTIISTKAHQFIMNPSDTFGDLLEALDALSRSSRSRHYAKLCTLEEVIQKGKEYAYCYKNFLSNCTSTYINQYRKIAVSVENKNYLSIPDVSKLLCTTDYKVLRLVKLGLLKLQSFKSNNSKSKVRLIEKRSVEEWINKGSELLSFQQVVHLLGLGRHHIVKLVEAEEVMPLSTYCCDIRNLVFEQKAICSYISQVLRVTKQVENVNEEYIPFTKAVTRLRHKGGIKKTMELIKGNKIRSAVLRSQNNFNGVFVLKSDLDRYMKEQLKNE